MVTAINATDASLLPTAADALPAFDFDKFEDLGAQLDGVAVVVNIWSSWCGPCRTEAPVLAAAARKYRASVQFLGVDILDDRADAASFILAHGWTYPSVFDASGEIRDQLGFVGQPETLFYSAGGHLVSTWIGPIPDDEMQRQIQAIAGGAQPSSAQSAEAAGR
jgi:thiol-disulfide isomerase/thioredoxin